MVFKWEVTLPALSGSRPRQAYIYLPDYYNEDQLRRYPVMYMFDGHNVFFDSDAAFGKSWGMNSFMSWTRKPLIIVAIVAAEVGNLVSGKTRIDILVTPIVTLLAGIGLALLIALPIGKAASWVGGVIMWATELHPFLMGIVVAVVVGMALTLPISSAAICFSLFVSCFYSLLCPFY